MFKYNTLTNKYSSIIIVFVITFNFVWMEGTHEYGNALTKHEEIK